MLYYKIEVLKKLIESGYTTTRLRQEKLLPEKTIQDLRHGKMIGIISLDKICCLLNMQPEQIIGFKET